jgi:cell division protein FtsB
VKVDLGIWSKLTQALVALVAIAVLALIGVRFLPLIKQNEQYRRHIEVLEVELQKQRDVSRQLRAEFEALRADPKTVERLAREKLGYARADDTVIHFEPGTNSASR